MKNRILAMTAIALLAAPLGASAGLVKIYLSGKFFPGQPAVEASLSGSFEYDPTVIPSSSSPAIAKVTAGAGFFVQYSGGVPAFSSAPAKNYDRTFFANAVWIFYNSSDLDPSASSPDATGKRLIFMALKGFDPANPQTSPVGQMAEVVCPNAGCAPDFELPDTSQFRVGQVPAPAPLALLGLGLAALGFARRPVSTQA